MGLFVGKRRMLFVEMTPAAGPLRLGRGHPVPKAPLRWPPWGSENDVDAAVPSGHTLGMKAAISIPDDVFEQGERLARRLHTSRSQLYARALADFVIQHDDEKITTAMNEVLEEVGAEPDDFTRRAAQQALRRVEW